MAQDARRLIRSRHVAGLPCLSSPQQAACGAAVRAAL